MKTGDYFKYSDNKYGRITGFFAYPLGYLGVTAISPNSDKFMIRYSFIEIVEMDDVQFKLMRQY